MHMFLCCFYTQNMNNTCELYEMRVWPIELVGINAGSYLVSVKSLHKKADL